MTATDAPLAAPVWDLRDAAGAPLAALGADERAAIPGATHTCLEFRDHYVRVPGAARIDAGDEALAPVPGGWWRLRYENRVGLSTLRARDAAGRDVTPPLTLLVRTAKLPSVAHHRALLDTLLADLFTRLARLPFVVAASTAWQTHEHHRPPDAIFAYHLLCAEAPAIRAAARVVAAQPHRRLASISEDAALHRVRRLDPAAAVAVARAPELAVLQGRASAAVLAGREPTTIPHRRAEETLDTPENRFAVHVLRTLLATARDLPRERWWSATPLARRETIAALACDLDSTLRDPWVRAVGPLTALPGASRVLQRREGYRDLARLWSELQQARRPLAEGLSRAIALLDIASLYELWTFFRIADLLGELHAGTPALELGGATAEGLTWVARATLPGIGVLRYNASRRGYADRTLRPDLLWEPVGGDALALDAKFRLDRPLEDGEKDGGAGWQNDDIVKMHAYRDALPIRAAVVLYPGDQDGFWTPDGTRLPLTLSDLLRDAHPGVGAFALRP